MEKIDGIRKFSVDERLHEINVVFEDSVVTDEKIKEELAKEGFSVTKIE